MFFNKNTCDACLLGVLGLNILAHSTMWSWYLLLYNAIITQYSGVSDCCLTPKLAIFQLYHGKNKIDCTFDDVRYVLHQQSWLIFIYCAISPRVDMSLHSETLSWFRANKTLFFLPNAACWVEKQHILNSVFG